MVVHWLDFIELSQREIMNSTAASDSTGTVPECDPAILQGTLDHTSQEANGWLVLITVICIVTCPLTTAMNALIIIAVKTKNQLKTKSNIALACLSTTDLVMGVIGKPLYISEVIAELQGNTSSTYCIRTLLATIVLRVLGIYSITVSLSHGEPREVHCYQTCSAVRNHRHWKTPHLFVISPVDYVIANNCLFKLTTMILFSLIFCYLPFIVARILIS